MDQDGLEQPSNVSAMDDKTIQQTPEGVSAAMDLSSRKLEQSEYAPRVPGYVLEDLLGEGAYGQVWRGVQIRTNKQVAVKVFIQRRGLDWIFLQREVERLTRLDRHPHVVTLLDTDLESEPPFYVMDLIEGGSLAQYSDPSTLAAPDRAVRWMEQVCQALSYVHGKGLIHCDLKPANILVDEQNNVRVVDFGQSRVFTESAASLGTLYYMAPEQADLGAPGAQIQPDVRWDVYALGATFYTLLFGRPPRASADRNNTLERAESLEQRLERYREIAATSLATDGVSAGGAVSRELFAVIGKCLAPKPEARYESVIEVLTDLEALRRNRPVSPLSGSRAYRTKKFVQRNPFRIGLVLVTLVLLPSLYIAWQEQAKASVSRAESVLVKFDYAPGEAYEEVASASGRFRSHLERRCEALVTSPASSLRVIGARGGLLVNPEAFWRSVDGGRLWEHGEWLALIGTEFSEDEWLWSALIEKACVGTDREKYVAFCLLGQLASEGRGLGPNRERLLELCSSAATSERWPGVVSAAAWAAARLGEEIGPESNELMFVDSLSGLRFVRIPSCASYRRGAATTDRDRYEDEEAVETPVAIASLFVSTTEVTMAALEGFLKSVASDAVVNWRTPEGGRAKDAILNELRDLTFDEKQRAAANYVSLDAARVYCDWLNAKVEDAPARRYRLPTEEEWEYACRGGNAGRYCFGGNSLYAPYFAQCNGSLGRFQIVGQKMPNWYGLFDLHGGLWEWTSGRYENKFVTESEHAGKEMYAYRGGGYYAPALRCRSTQRNRGEAHGSNYYLGFRLVMELTE